MAKSKQKQEKAPNAFITLEDVACLMGKFSNNLVLESTDDDDEDAEEVGVWTFPFTGIMLSDELLNALYQDEYTHRCWYQTKKGVSSPMPWVGLLPPPIPYGQKFDQAAVTIAYAESPNKNTARDEFEDCKIGRIVLYPQQGGLTEMRCSIQIKPGLGKENQRLQEYQNRRVSISIVSAAVSEKKSSRQPELALGAPSPGKEGDQAGDGFAAAAKTQVDAWKNRHRKPGEAADDESEPAGTH